MEFNTAFPGLIGSALYSIPRKQCRIDSHSYPRQDKNSPLVMFDRMPLRSFAVRVEYKYVFNILHARFGPEVLFLDLKATTADQLLNCFETWANLAGSWRLPIPRIILPLTSKLPIVTFVADSWGLPEALVVSNLKVEIMNSLKYIYVAECLFTTIYSARSTCVKRYHYNQYFDNDRDTLIQYNTPAGSNPVGLSVEKGISRWTCWWNNSVILLSHKRQCSLLQLSLLVYTNSTAGQYYWTYISIGISVSINSNPHTNPSECISQYRICMAMWRGAARSAASDLASGIMTAPLERYHKIIRQ